MKGNERSCGCMYSHLFSSYNRSKQSPEVLLNKIVFFNRAHVFLPVVSERAYFSRKEITLSPSLPRVCIRGINMFPEDELNHKTHC